VGISGTRTALRGFAVFQVVDAVVSHKEIMKISVIIMMGLAVLTGCSKRETELDTTIMNGFWIWFDQHKDSIATGMKSGDEEAIRITLKDVDTRLQKTAPGISFLFCDHDGEYEFIVTAGGQREHFSNVQSFVDAAPKIDGWRITAFRQPSDDNFKLEMGGIAISASDIEFQAFDLVDGGVGITLYPADMTEDQRDLYSHAAVTLLDHVVGECDAVTKINSLVVDPPAKIEPGIPVRSMTELREFLNQQQR
jgi:hypothetical protein